MIEFIIVGMFAGVGFIAYHSKWLDKFAEEMLKRDSSNAYWYNDRLHSHSSSGYIPKSKGDMMYRIISNGFFYDGNKLTKNIEKAKIYKTRGGATQAITKANLKKTRLVPLSDSEQMEKFSDEFDTNYIDKSDEGIIVVKKHTTTPRNEMSSTIDQMRDLVFDNKVIEDTQARIG